MIDSIKPNEWKRFLWAAAACFIIYLSIDVAPLIASIHSGDYNPHVIEKAAAEEKAAAFAERQTGLKVKKAKAVHQTDKIMNGYLSKEELTGTYSDQYDSRFPTDTFQVDLKFDQGGSGYTYVHMQSGEVVAWNLHLDGQPLSDEDKTAEIVDFLLNQQFRAEELSGGRLLENGEWQARPVGFTVKDARLSLNVDALSVRGKTVITKYKAAFIAPNDYIKYVKGQDKIAGFLTGFGYLFMSFVLFVLAIVYAVLYRKFTSFKYGIALTIVYFVTYIIMNLNILDGIRASFGENGGADETVLITAVFTVFLTFPMAAAVYISIVAGDGLWKAQGRSLWPRFGEKGYGSYVWRSMGLSYLFAVILFALQSIIFIGLEFTIGTWGTTDATQSPYNMSILWLMPVLAWAAAISEEAVFRFFGIGLFRKWFKNTFAAALLPTFFWALGHVMYPFYPSSTRLIELMIVGLVFSFIFVRYGFITAMFTHAIFNSAAVGMSLLTIGTAPNIVSAIFFTVLPVLIACVIRYLSNKKEKGRPLGRLLP
ncbi:CPBP family glutamic-type intramembrane protease [Paenibacillus alkaliterrae]|uniref:CPBP family intramembrane glutamic endopeptidase n=1 Tax=Paenibacillus alkaliterrae TaxID=320909 RepID=UPI001F30FF2E|nr:CPBP family glutamic-type intramembrane protease [Paenibacillus alkaliterrae]MCF2940305.1 CPBP family glutamic-type intramembrane protease [Paenibacillus alkaliterrae]